MADLTPEQKATAEAEAAAKQAAARAEAAIPSPPKDADFNAVADMHQQLIAENKHELAAAFHKKHVLGFKASK